jgi:Na+-driven multidrug efflux pump
VANVEPFLAARTSRLIKFTGPICSMMFFNRITQAFLSSQEIVDELLYPNLAGIVVGITIAKYFIIDFGWQEMGFLPAKLCQEIIGCSFCIYYLWAKANREIFKFPPLAEIINGYSVFMGKLFFSAAGTVAEWATFEINTLMAIQLQDLDQLAVYLDWTGISPLFYMIGMGFATAIRIIVGTMMGEGETIRAKHELQADFVYVTIFSLVCSLIFGLNARNIAEAYVKNEEIAEGLRQAILSLSFFIWGYLMFYPAFQAFRLIDEEKYFLKVLLTLYMGGNTVVAWFLAYPCGMKSVGLVIAHGLANCLVQGFFCKKVFMDHDWTKEPLMLRERLASKSMRITNPLVSEVITTEMLHLENK